MGDDTDETVDLPERWIVDEVRDEDLPVSLHHNQEGGDPPDLSPEEPG